MSPSGPLSGIPPGISIEVLLGIVLLILFGIPLEFSPVILAGVLLNFPSGVPPGIDSENP